MSKLDMLRQARDTARQAQRELSALYKLDMDDAEVFRAFRQQVDVVNRLDSLVVSTIQQS